MPEGKTESPFDLSGRVALVTGAGRGIGRAIALGLASAGADVAISARSSDQLDSACDEIRSMGRKALALPANLADLDELAGVFGSVEAEFGQLDILFNNAGTGFRKPLLEITPTDWDYVADLNLRSLFFACQHGIRLMEPRGYGRIINTASLTSFLGFAQVSVYGATKGGVAQLTKALAVEFAQSGITINAIAPGYVFTELTRPRFEDPVTRNWLMSRIPQGRHAEPDDMAGTALFLASDASAYLTGVVVPVDGGWLAA
jgi:NAD(P)-dependent dehydrogenase (short-subunit alcohol dehydrogenase family)